MLEDVATALAVRFVDVEPPVQPAGTHQRRVEDIRPVRGADDEDNGLRSHRTTDDAEPTQQLVFHTVFDMLSERVHLIEHRVEREAAPAHHSHRTHHSLLLPALNAAS